MISELFYLVFSQGGLTVLFVSISTALLTTFIHHRYLEFRLLESVMEKPQVAHCNINTQLDWTLRKKLLDACSAFYLCSFVNDKQGGLTISCESVDMDTFIVQNPLDMICITNDTEIMVWLKEFRLVKRPPIEFNLPHQFIRKSESIALFFNKHDGLSRFYIDMTYGDILEYRFPKNTLQQNDSYMVPRILRHQY